jgi:hypothetical protein
VTVGDLEGLTALWADRWGGSPISYELRDRHADRWVRFHSLPGSKRYAETESEYAVILDRHHTVLTELGTGGGLYVIAGYFEETAGLVGRPDPRVHSGAVFWRAVQPDEHTYFEIPLHLHASCVPHTQAALDPILRATADEGLVYVIIAPADLRWLYHPYDGGADVIATSERERDTLKHRHATWLSAHPLGL